MPRLFALVLFAFALVGANYPDPPAVLDPYFQGGQFDPGDFGWMRGKFPEASEAEKVASAEVEAWVKACFDIGVGKASAALAERDLKVADPARLGAAPMACLLVSSRPADLSSFTDFEHFSEVLADTRPIVDAVAVSAETAARVLETPDDGLAERLQKRPLREQILRFAFDWVFRPHSDFPQLSTAQKPIFMALLGQEVTRVDAANTEWLKDIVAQHGWPTVSTVGEKASEQAWLLVQHADHDPVFQLDVLRMIEPLVAEKQVSPRDYAYLYDRVMLKVTGKQRYATQMWCQQGKMEPQPLEDADRVPEWRASAQLGTLEDYRESFPDTC